MSNNFFSTSKVLEGMLDDLPLFSVDDLNDLKDAITDELKAREHKQMIELKEKAIQALRDFLNAGGYILNNKDDYNWRLDEALTSSDEDDPCIFLR